MPRDASGNYTLPAGNPVVTGTTIDSSWANNTMDDLATAMQDSLSRSGDGGMLVPFQNASGNVAAPGISWTSEPSSGLYLAAANDMRVSIAGVDRVQFRANSTDPFRIWNTTAGAWQLPLNEGSNYTITGDWTFSGTTVVPEATVTVHEAALTILETQISDGNLLARFADQTTVFNSTDDATGDLQVGSTAAVTKQQSFSLVNAGRDVMLALTTDGVNFGLYDNTAAEWAIRAIPSTSKVEIYGEVAALLPTKSSFTGTLQECTTAPTETFHYSITPIDATYSLVRIWMFPAGTFQATSNSDRLSVTGLPAAIRPSSNDAFGICTAVDSGSGAGSFQFTVTTAGGFVFYKDGFSTGFTASGIKGLSFGGNWEISYVID